MFMLFVYGEIKVSEVRNVFLVIDSGVGFKFRFDFRVYIRFLYLIVFVYLLV